MKNLVQISLLIALLIAVPSFGQLNKLKEKAASAGIPTGGFSKDEAAKALKEALSKGAEKGTDLVSKEDGFNGNPAIKIPFPEEAAEIEKKVRKVPGGNKKCDNVVLSINRAAELAAKEAKEVFIAAIKQMTVSDAIAIVKGEDNAATNYLKKTTTEILVTKFSPIIEKALSTTGATKQWEAVMTTYNKIPMTKKINPDLVDYVSRKAIDGLFQMIEKEEANIRNNDVARSSVLLKKVFGQTNDYSTYTIILIRNSFSIHFDVERYEILDNFTGLEDISKIDEPIKNLLAIQFFEKEGENSMFVVSKKVVDSTNEYITKEGNKIFVNFDEHKQVINIEGTMIWLDLNTAMKHFEAMEGDENEDED